MMATLLIMLLHSSGAYGPYSLPWCVYETVLTGCLEAWCTYTTLVLALFMEEQSRLGFKNSARSSQSPQSFWQRNRWTLWALTAACVIYPLCLITLNMLLSLLTKTVSPNGTASQVTVRTQQPPTAAHSTWYPGYLYSNRQSSSIQTTYYQYLRLVLTTYTTVSLHHSFVPWIRWYDPSQQIFGLRSETAQGAASGLWGIALWSTVQPFACIYCFNSARK